MTSSVTSTENRLARRGSEGDGPPAVGPNAGPPEPRRGLSPTAIRRLVVGAFVWLPAIGLVVALYGGKLTVGSLFLAFGWVTFALAAWFIGRAAIAFDVAEGDALEGSIDDERRTELSREKKVLLKAIKEVEFDHQMGKIDDHDAAEITATYRARALEIMRLLDENKSVDYPAMVEKELARRLAKAGGLAKKALPAATAEAGAAEAGAAEAGAAQAAADADEPVLSREVETAAAAAGTCGSCGTRNDADAVFCKKCAARLGS
jgi:hypothetical protein